MVRLRQWTAPYGLIYPDLDSGWNSSIKTHSASNHGVERFPFVGYVPVRCRA